VETPSHTGGISKEAHDRQLERMQKQKYRSVLQASSKDKEREKERVQDAKDYNKRHRARDIDRGSHDRGKESIVCFAAFMIYLLTAVGLSPGGSMHLHTNSM
jgi:hypothetical protein